MRDVYVRVEADCAVAVARHEGLAVVGPGAVQGVVHDVCVDRVNAVLFKLLQQLLCVQVPQD